MSTVEANFEASKFASRLIGADPWRKYRMVSHKEALSVAESAGLFVVYPEPTQLQLDIDDHQSMNRYYLMEGMLRALFNVKEISERSSKSGIEHKHITITLANPISDVERILLQAVLGSDPKRELLSYIRLMKEEPYPTMFFETKDKPQEKQEILF